MPRASSWDDRGRPQNRRISWATLMFQDLKEQSEHGSAHPTEFQMTGGHHLDRSRTKQVKLTGTSAVSYREAEPICIE